jgi:uncharacterized protein (DUF2141 family)
MMAALEILAVGAMVVSSPDLGTAEGRCRVSEAGPAFLVAVKGLKDRTGRLKLELYPDNDADFLADDNVLVNANKSFRRVEMGIPTTGEVQLCIRAPAPGSYALSLLHDRNGDRRFNLSNDGIGFPGDPKLGWSKPRAILARAQVGSGPAHITITLQYRVGLFRVAPLKSS